jgi:Fe-S cluster assembly protein SufB
MKTDLIQPKNREAEDEMRTIEKTVFSDYKYGFVTNIEADEAPRGLNEDVIRFISARKKEPHWMLEWRLKAYRHWLTMKTPDWANIKYPPIDYQNIIYYSAPKQKVNPKNLDEIDPELLRTFEKLGISLDEQKRLTGVAVDAVIDSVSIGTSFKGQLAELGIIFCSMSEAIQEHPDLIREYLGTVVPVTDNYFSALNAAVFSDGSFVYIPKGVRCPMELSTYFRINAENTGQFERTLIIADADSYVSYLEGCTAPMRDENQLHAAVVELITQENAEIKYSTVQNWYPGDKNGMGGVYNFVTKRGICKGNHSKISWTQVETGSAITWKYPSVILKGDYSTGEFYSVAVTNNYQQADTGTKMMHLGKNTRSRIVSKGISAGYSNNSYRGLVHVSKNASNSRNFSQCDSLLLGDKCGAHTFPYIEVRNNSAVVEHEATTSKIGEDQIFYCNQRGIDTETAVALIINGFAKEVMNQLPMEFAVEAQKLLAISLEGSVG